jgi:hypothetical protein
MRHRPWWLLPSFNMLLVLLASVIAYPFVDATPGLRPVAQLLDVAAVLMVVRLIRSADTIWSSGWVVAIPTVALQFWHLAMPASTVEVAMLISQLAFHGWAIIALLSYVLSDQIITRDELFAIAGIYVLMALFWASAYALVVHFDPAALVINEANDPDGRTTWADLVYYSMTTLTSTGYGDITPLSPPAHALAMLQQVTGVLFVAILIARLTTLGRRRGS